MSIQEHKHTQTCEKNRKPEEEVEKCRFHFPHFPIHKTIISVPSKILYDDEEERARKVKRAKEMLSLVKTVLLDKNLMSKIQNFKCLEMEAMVESNLIEWKVRMLCEVTQMEKKEMHYQLYITNI